MLKKTLLATAVLCFSVHAQAFDLSEANGYVFGNIGSAYSKKPSEAKKIDTTMTDGYRYGGRTKYEGSDTAFKLGAGLNLDETFAVELQYADFGKRKYKVTTTQPATGKVNYETWGLGLNVVAGAYIDAAESIRLYGKAGINHMKTDVKLKEDLVFTDGKSSKKKRRISPSLGLGASFDITKELALTAEYDYYHEPSKNFVKTDLHMGSVGVRYNF